MLKVTVILRLRGKASQVFKYLAILAEQRGNETLGQILKEYGK